MRWLVFTILSVGSLTPTLAAQAPRVTILHDSRTSTIIEFVLNDYTPEPIAINGIPYSKISIPGCPTHMTKGMPEVPTITRNIIIGNDTQVKYRILDIECETMHSTAIAPSKGNLPRTIDHAAVPYTFDQYYHSDTWWPEKAIELDEPFIMRDYRGIGIRFNPIQYNPARQELKIVRRIVVEVYAAGKSDVNVLHEKNHVIAREFNDIYEHLFLNFMSSRYDSISERAGRMIIITADAYNANLQPFAYWKKLKGIDTKIVNISTIGNDQTSIKDYIQDEYDAGDLVWVLLVGDGNEVVPAIGTVGSAIGKDADPVYAYTAGNDYYPDLFIARFSSRGSAMNIDKQVNRSIYYERTPQDSADWYHVGLGIASNLGTPSDKIRCNWLRDSLLLYHYTSVDSSYDPWGTNAIIKSRIEAGTGIINYIGHGSTTSWINGGGFSNNDLNNLNNPWMLPFVISVACVVGNFNGWDCFCEVSVTAGEVNQPDGFLAHWGSSINQTWVPPCYGQEGAVNLLTHDRKNTFGGICFNGACSMIEFYGSTNPDGIEMAQTWHVFGDPSVQLRSDTPGHMNVVHDSLVPADTTDFIINVMDDDGATPLKNALVCCWIYTQVPEVYESGYTDSSGTLVLTMAPQNPGDTMWITVTHYNYSPYEQFALVRSTGIAKEQSGTISTAPMLQVHPSITRSHVQILWAAGHADTPVDLKIFDAAGRLVRDFVLAPSAAPQSLIWDRRDQNGQVVPAGIYFIRFASDDFQEIEKTILVR